MRRDRGRQPAQVKVRRGVGSRQLPLKRPAPTFLPSFRAVCLVRLHSPPQAHPLGTKDRVLVLRGRLCLAESAGGPCPLKWPLGKRSEFPGVPQVSYVFRAFT